jgi:hypothetical protein
MSQVVDSRCQDLVKDRKMIILTRKLAVNFKIISKEKLKESIEKI